jgi:hypothetical protein
MAEEQLDLAKVEPLLSPATRGLVSTRQAGATHADVLEQAELLADEWAA